MSVFGWDDFGRDRKGKGERGEKKLFWVVWLEGKRGEILVEPMRFLPVPTKKINPQFGESYGEIIVVIKKNYKLLKFCFLCNRGMKVNLHKLHF